MSSERPSKCAAAFAGLKNASTDLGEEMPDDAFRKLIWRIYKVASVYKINLAINVKVPPEAWVLSWLPSIAQTGNNTRTHLGNCPAPP